MSAVLKLPSLGDRYSWQAELKDGAVISKGGDISQAARVSLIPAPHTGLVRHDLIGLAFVRRFLRQFKRATVGGFDKEKYWAQVEAQQGESRKAARAARDLKGLKPKLPELPKKPAPRDECVSVIVTNHSRFYVRHSDGTVLVTPPDYELFL